VTACTVCSAEFEPDEEGAEGFFGILPVAFCGDCRVAIIDFAHQCMPDISCAHCGLDPFDEEAALPPTYALIYHSKIPGCLYELCPSPRSCLLKGCFQPVVLR